VTTFTGYGDGEGVHGLVQDIELGYTKSVDFVVPPGVNWPLPIYELALMTAARAKDMGMTPKLRVVTPEGTPLAVFGAESSAGVAALLHDAGIEFVGGQRAVQQGEWRPVLRPSGEPLRADRIVTVSTLTGTAPGGIPANPRRFIHTDAYGRVEGVDDVYAAGDVTDFPIEQGGIAAQQADTIAEVIAKRAGAPLEPRELHPVLKGLLLTGGADHPLGGDVTQKIGGRYLAPYLESLEIEAERALTSR
jgi:sulfide:quinone oxidoreductase